MKTNIRLLLKACKECNIRFETLPHTHNLVRVVINQKPCYFTNLSTPFISQSIGQLFRDKDYTYHLGKDKVNIPKTKAFLSYFCEKISKSYLVYEDVDSITEEIKKTFPLPVIIKINAGTFGNNVFLCHDLEEVRLSLKQIFDINSKNYDDIALAQEYIDIAHEYRAIIFNYDSLY